MPTRCERRACARLALACATLALPAPAAAQVAGARAPSARANVLVIVADDLGYADIGVHGCTDIPTPNIDRLAREGVRCTNGYVTAPRCAPSRCGLLTGRYQQRFGCELGAGNGLPGDVPTLAQLLKPSGYATGLIGKWHLGRKSEHDPNARGFDEFFGFLGGVSISLPKPGKASIPRIFRNREPADVPGYLTDAFGHEAVSFLERHAHEPFFLLLSFQAPHEPVEAPREAVARFGAIRDPMRRTYAASVAGMDAAIGTVLAKLEALALEERTLVFFLSDNGGPQKARWNGSSNAPLRGNKGGLWEAGIRVPFLARWPGVLPAGFVYDEPVSALDIVPTALALAGLPAPADLDGVDILPHLRQLVLDPPHAALFWRYNDIPGRIEHHKWAVRAGDTKLVHSPERAERTLEVIGAGFTGLYDVRCDPEEEQDLAGRLPEVVERLTARWQEWNALLPETSGAGSAAADEDGEADEIEEE